MTTIRDIDGVIGVMRLSSQEAAARILDAEQKKGKKDSAAGIFIASFSTIPVAMVDGQYFRLSGARVLGISAGQPYVTPHYHLLGDEPYYFLNGVYEMNIGRISKSGDEVLWRKPVVVGSLEVFVIHPGDVHSLRNLGEEPADFVFACPENHLLTNDSDHPSGDRYLVSNLKNPRPPHYPQ